METYSDTYDSSLQLTSDPTEQAGGTEKLGVLLTALGLLSFLIAPLGGEGSSLGEQQPVIFFWLGFGLTAVGALIFILKRYGSGHAGIRNDGVMFAKTTTRSWFGWSAAIVLTGFYCILYWKAEWLYGLVRVMDPLSYMIRGREADQWFLYGAFYTLAVLIMGVRAILRYRHNRYQIIRSISVMGVQLVLAFLIPAFLIMMNQPEFYFSYFWPLKYDYLFPDTFTAIEQSGGFGVFAIRWAALMTFVGTPILTYFFGKRWYCSWVCGCGGLAETAGDPYRQLSDKSLSAWKIERWMIHSVLVFVTITTALLWINSATEGGVLGGLSLEFKQVYGFAIGLVFAGVIGVGFYPLMGARVWCRFGCPMAAILGIGQKYFSRFRITTNGAQCISCGNCSTYCEMGIDVRAYAQRGQNVIRASCVGCGICSAVCPRGVLNLENDSRKGRYNDPVLVPEGDIMMPVIDRGVDEWRTKAFEDEQS